MEKRFLRPGEQRPGAFGVSFSQEVPPRRLQEEDDDSPLVYNRFKHLRIDKQQELLPIHAYKRDILYLVEKHSTVVLVGETGSGKTTQVPQYLLAAGWAPVGRRIACTQPRRIATMSIAARVAQEMNVTLGTIVGYAVRFEDVSSDRTRIQFCTDDVLLQEMSVDPLLTKYTVIMVDEAHERSIATDILLGLLKKIQRRRPSLRLIVSSATIHAEAFASYFENKTKDMDVSEAHADRPTGTPGILSVQGRPHTVHINYLDKACQDYFRMAIDTTASINTSDLPGDILVFLTSQEECQKAVEWIKDLNATTKNDGRSPTLFPVALYSGLAAKHQLAVFEAPPRDHRKVIFATNIAETSVTIDGVVHVVDCMFSKQRSFDPLVGIESILVAPISKASAAQRSGRAGRVRIGFSYRLCTEEAFKSLKEVDTPEIQRSDLTSIVLQLKGLGIDNLLLFSWLATPSAENMVRSLENLHALGALGDDAKLTEHYGKYMVEFASIDPHLSKAMLLSWQMNCVYEVTTIVAMLLVQHIWAPGRYKVLNKIKSQFGVKEGDLITYLNVWKAWEENRRSSSWAFKNFISQKSLCQASEIRNHLLRLLFHLKRQSQGNDPIFSKCSLEQVKENLFMRKDLSVSQIDERILRIRQCFARGLFLNAVRMSDPSDLDSEGLPVYKLLRNTGDPLHDVFRLRIHRDSVLYGSNDQQWLCFYKAQQAGKHSIDMLIVHSVDPEWLASSNFFSISTKKTF